MSGLSEQAVPTVVSWNLTRRCNLACRHCYLDATQRKCPSPAELTTVESCRVIEQVAALAPGAMLVMSGGEPLLRGDLPRLVAHAAARRLTPVVGTNGTLLTERRARTLQDAGAGGVGVSVDSAAAAFHDRLRGARGAWRGALRGALAAQRAGMAVSLQATLFEQNCGELAALADLAESVGAMALNFFFLVCTGRGAKQTDLTPRQYDETLVRILQLQRERPRLLIRARCAPYVRRVLALRGGDGAARFAAWSSACLAGRSYLRITPEGQVTPCPYIPEVLGALTQATLREIWEHHPALQRLRSELPAGKCGSCDFRYGCGGCRARALAAHGDLMGEDPNCIHVRPAGALPEPAPQASPDPDMAWEPAAQALLQRIPGFVRMHVKARLELRAAREGRNLITADFMRAHRPPSVSPGRDAADTT
ncbi:MAG: hypothetical protein A3H97_06710 [Acidobacteria bacterium RIFCSPLOWO2_02_FULL_65_29]|nr:MAG: hypothetical protein A3H97_06710 [Acidobacteria bacterium RIFCSPLOWO2_02_FULL_65_29]